MGELSHTINIAVPSSRLTHQGDPGTGVELTGRLLSSCLAGAGSSLVSLGAWDDSSSSTSMPSSADSWSSFSPAPPEVVAGAAAGVGFISGGSPALTSPAATAAAAAAATCCWAARRAAGGGERRCSGHTERMVSKGADVGGRVVEMIIYCGFQMCRRSLGYC